MNTAELTALLDRLRAEPRETEWLEFKANRHEPQVLGEYLSALANSACLLGKPRAYLVFGIEDGSHAVVGTTFDPHAETGKGRQLLSLWLSLGLHPNVGFETHIFTYQGKRVVLFEVHPAFDRPVHFYGKAYVRDGTSKTDWRSTRKRSARFGTAAWTGARRSASRRRWTIWTRVPSPRRVRSSPPSPQPRRRRWRHGMTRPFSTRRS
jgi:predicted HTH transcriptional regulator